MLPTRMRKKIGSLECLVREGDSERDVVVLLHGFGANAADLLPIANYVDPDGHWTFVFPNAPLEVAIGGGFKGRGWFPIPLQLLETGVNFQNARPPELAASAAAVRATIFELNAERLVLGGFSQGAMVSTEVGLQSPADVAGLILLSGTMIDHDRWKKMAPELIDKPIYQTHGSADQVLPLNLAKMLYEMLKDAGAKIDFFPFGGGHDIPPAALAGVGRFLKGIRTLKP